MGRTLILATLAAAILAVPVALAGDTPGDGTLSVKRGKGLIQLYFKGTAIGRINGRIQVRDFKPFDDNDPQILGCKVRHSLVLAGVSFCKGKNVSFRVLDGRYNVRLQGVGIFLSAVGQGTVIVDGQGDEGVVNDGVMALNDDPYMSLPDSRTSLLLQAPQPQPGG
jgi:hypothetical protein